MIFRSPAFAFHIPSNDSWISRSENLDTLFELLMFNFSLKLLPCNASISRPVLDAQIDPAFMHILISYSIRALIFTVMIVVTRCRRG